MDTTSRKLITIEPKFEYVTIKDLFPLLKKGEKLCLENGFYFNKDESVVIKSSNETGKFIRKLYGT
jgi:hypothetical protein